MADLSALWLKAVNNRLLRFAVCALVATCSHWVVMAYLVMSGVAPELGTAIGAVVGAGVNYILQYYVAFESSRDHGQAIRSYVLSCLIGWSANLLVFSLLFLWWPGQILLAQVATTIVVAFLNYFLYRRMVFDDRVSPRLAN